MNEHYVCRCEEITKEQIEYAIEHGADTVNSVKRRTRACMGFCQGKTCRREVSKIVAAKTGQPISDVEPSTFRAPVRPMEIEIMAGDFHDE